MRSSTATKLCVDLAFVVSGTTTSRTRMARRVNMVSTTAARGAICLTLTISSASARLIMETRRDRPGVTLCDSSIHIFTVVVVLEWSCSRIFEQDILKNKPLDWIRIASNDDTWTASRIADSDVPERNVDIFRLIDTITCSQWVLWPTQTARMCSTWVAGV